MTYDGFETFASGIGNDDYDEMMIPFFFLFNIHFTLLRSVFSVRS